MVVAKTQFQKRFLKEETITPLSHKWEKGQDMLIGKAGNSKDLQMEQVQI